MKGGDAEAYPPTALRQWMDAMSIAVQFLGSGDAFGSGGRFQACISLRVDGAHLLLDCGATSLAAMKRYGVDPSSVDAVVLTHLHGDHFGGIPFLVLDGQFSRRERPLLVLGPAGTRARIEQAMEVFFPGSSSVERRFELCVEEISERTATTAGPFTVTAYEVPHASGAPAHALRFSHGDKVIAYSGDTEWSEALVDAADGADLFICEAYFFDKVVKQHLAYTTLAEHRARLNCRRLILTHMSADMLAHRHEATDELAEDGLTITL
jgi:ribonuclease BN (tRNA processing enzyme)